MKKRILIDGMKCENCAKHVKEALIGVEGITSVEVNLSDKYAIIESSIEVNEKAINLAVNNEKYKVVKIVAL